VSRASANPLGKLIVYQYAIGSSTVLRVTFGLVETIVFLHLAATAREVPRNYIFYPIPPVRFVIRLLQGSKYGFG
jgi:hypothetical protein